MPLLLDGPGARIKPFQGTARTVEALHAALGGLFQLRPGQALLLSTRVQAACTGAALRSGAEPPGIGGRQADRDDPQGVDQPDKLVLGPSGH